MSSQPVLVVIGVAIVVNLVIMGVLLAMLAARRRPAAASEGVGVPSQYRYDMVQGVPTAVGPVTYMNDEPSQASVRAMDEYQMAPDPTGVFRGSGGTTPQVEDTIKGYFAADAVPAGDGDTTAPVREEVVVTAPPMAAAAPAPPMAEAAAPMTPGTTTPHLDETATTDVLTGLDGPVLFDGRIRDEDARFNRYRRPVSVVLFELDGLDRLADLLGPDARTRILRPVGQSIRRQARATDYIARVGEGRFAALLPETDEVQAINFVERVRTECDRWLASGAVSMRMAIGWSSPPPGGQLSTALRVAQDRLDRDRRRATSV